MAAGVFDRRWRRDDRWVFLGDSEMRGRSPLRHLPPPDFSVSQEALHAYAGRYQLFPGFVISIINEGPRLKIVFPMESPIELIAESESEFAISTDAASLVFTRDAQNKVTGFVLNNDGRETLVKKVE